MRLMIACPRTGEPIPVASAIERKSLIRLSDNNSMNSPCAACGAKHSWRMTDAWIEDEWRAHMVDAT